MKLLIHIILPVTALFIACGGSEESNDDSAETIPVPPSAVELPGTLIAPTGDTLEVHPGVTVVVYYWLPLELYEEAADDLLYLSSLGDGFLPLPVQPDHEARNHAQTIVNDREISLPVDLADSVFMESLDCGILPVCMVIHSDGHTMWADGFGSPERLLSDSPSEEP